MLGVVAGNVDGELLNAETSLGAALFTTKEMRQDWINRINQYFDVLDVKISDFAQSALTYWIRFFVSGSHYVKVTFLCRSDVYWEYIRNVNIWARRKL